MTFIEKRCSVNDLKVLVKPKARLQLIWCHNLIPIGGDKYTLKHKSTRFYITFRQLLMAWYWWWHSNKLHGNFFHPSTVCHYSTEFIGCHMFRWKHFETSKKGQKKHPRCIDHLTYFIWNQYNTNFDEICQILIWKPVIFMTRHLSCLKPISMNWKMAFDWIENNYSIIIWIFKWEINSSKWNSTVRRNRGKQWFDSKVKSFLNGDK